MLFLPSTFSLAFPTQSIMEYNGAAIVAMVGKNCVAIAADRRLGVQAQTVSTTFQKIFQLNDTLFVGLPGLATDVHTVWVSHEFPFSMLSKVCRPMWVCMCMYTWLVHSTYRHTVLWGANTSLYPIWTVTCPSWKPLPQTTVLKFLLSLHLERHHPSLPLSSHKPFAT